jgi:rubrerythrin
MREIYIFEDLLNTLIELEIKGFAFYEKYKNITEDQDLKWLFGELAVAEKNMKRFIKV